MFPMRELPSQGRIRVDAIYGVYRGGERLRFDESKY
jgi:hypothetical protein